MRILVRGNKRQAGLTLLELLVVISIIALATAGVSLALRDNASTQLVREADRLIAVLEAARAQSRSSGVALVWVARPDGFAVVPQAVLDQAAALGGQLQIRADALSPWLAAGTQVTIVVPSNASQSSSRPSANTVANSITLGPEPMLAAQGLELQLKDQRLSIASDGLRPFALSTTESTP